MAGLRLRGGGHTFEVWHPSTRAKQHLFSALASCSSRWRGVSGGGEMGESIVDLFDGFCCRDIFFCLDSLAHDVLGEMIDIYLWFWWYHLQMGWNQQLSGDSIRDLTWSPSVGGHVYNLWKGSFLTIPQRILDEISSWQFCWPFWDGENVSLLNGCWWQTRRLGIKSGQELNHMDWGSLLIRLQDAERERKRLQQQELIGVEGDTPFSWWAPVADGSKWSYRAYKWPYKWLTGVIVIPPSSGVISLLIIGRSLSWKWKVQGVFPAISLIRLAQSVDQFLCNIYMGREV